MPVRDLEWFSAARTGLSVVSNRGANGIDGVVSTAVGLALAAPGPVAVLVGDVAMLHDTNALLGLVSRSVDLTVVVVDNDGGGIFSFLPQAGALPTDRFEEMFGTPHGVDLAALAIAHNLEATVVDDLGSLAGVIKSSAGHRGTTVVVVRTRRDANVVVHSRLHNGVIEAVSQGVELPGWP
jgi:2-succinyl-5-enolpyruvyl-6-hydroxy-3-cyclohexene-1-carboxylate synthase